MMQVSKKIPFDDPNVLLGIRAVYILSNVIIAAIYLYTQSKINSKKGTRLPVPSTPSSSSSQLPPPHLRALTRPARPQT